MKNCKIGGVSFHKNMDLKTLVSQWAKVPQSAKDANPTMNDSMNSASTLLNTQQTTISATTQAKQLFNTLTVAVNTSAAALTGNVGYVGAEAGTVTADAQQIVQDNLVESQKTVIYSQLCPG